MKLKPKPIEAVQFSEHSQVIGANQSQYRPLYAHRTRGRESIVTTCWAPSFVQRLKILFFGRIWVQQMTFQKPLQPILMLDGMPEVRRENGC